MKRQFRVFLFMLLVIISGYSISAFSAVNPVGSDYTNNSSNASFNSAGRSNADRALTKDTS